MSGDKTLSITIVATSDKAQKELSKLADSAEHMGLRVGAASEKVAKGSAHVEHFGSSTRTAMEGVQAAASSVGASLGPVGEILEKVSVSFSHVDESAGRAHKALQVAGVAAMAVGGIIMAESVAEQASMAQLKTAVDNTGKSWEEYAGHLHHAAQAQAVNGHSAKDATDALTKLTAGFNDPERAMKEMAVTADLAARNHISLADAAQMVVKVHAGAFKVLTQFGIVTRDLVDPAKELAAAQRDAAVAATQLAGVQERLGNFEAGLAAQRAAGEAEHASRVQAAQDKIAQADQHLADVQQTTAERRKSAQTAANAAVESSSASLANARQHLSDVEEQIHQRTQLTLQDQFSLRDSQQRLADVQERIADGSLSGAAAQQALRDAHQGVTDTQALQAEKTRVTSSEQDQLRNATHAVAKATDTHSDAQDRAATAGRETTGEAVALRNALHGVSAAHDGLAKAQASGSGGETLAQMQQERRLREELATAMGKQAKAAKEMAKATADQANFGKKTDEALKMLYDKVKGSADAQSKTISGMFHRWVAEAQNAFAGLTPAVGMSLIAVGSAIDIFTALSLGKWIAYGASTLAINASVFGAIVVETITAGASMLAGWVVSMAGMIASSIAAGASMLIAFAPIILAIAAIGIAAYVLYKHWHQIWGFIKNIVSEGVHFVKDHIDWIIAIAFGPFGIAINLIRKHWDDIWGAIKSVAGGLGSFFSGVFGGLADIILAPMRLVIWTINSIIDLIDSIKFDFHAPSWAGGFGWKFDGFGIPHLPSFADGGIVPGATGSPQLVIAHGGEEIRNAAQMRNGGPRGGVTEVHVHIHAEGSFFPDERSMENFGRKITPHVLEGLHRIQNQGRDLQLTGRAR